MKTGHILLLAAAASLTLAACSKDGGQAADDQELRLSTANIISETRASSQSLQLTQFDKNEKVDIFLAEDVSGTATASGGNVTEYIQPLSYTADGSGGLSITDAQYWPTSGNGLHIHGVYPSGAAGASASYNPTNISFSVKPDQSSDAGYKASDLMTGKPSNNPVTRTTSAVPLTFTHLLTKVNINLTEGDGFTSGGLSNANVYIQNTKPTTTFDVRYTTLGSATGDAADITVCTGTTGSAIIVPQTVNASTAFIKVAVGGGEYIYKLAAQTEFKQSNVYTYNITVNKTGLTVTSTIASWTSSGSTTDGNATLQ